MIRRNRRHLTLQRLETRDLLAGDINLVRHFDLWDGGVIPSTDGAGITYNSSTGSLFIADSEINEMPQFVGDNIFETSLLGDQLLL